MNNKIMIIILVMITLVGLILSTGGKRYDVYLSDYSISEDGSKITLHIATMSSMGYVREAKIKQGEANQYITFYSTFGLNSDFGAKDQFEIDLSPSCDAIYFYSGDGGYRLKLKRNLDTNEWEEVK